VETCWFCRRRPASLDTAYRATVYGDKKNPPAADGRSVESDSQSARVAVPIARCGVCAAQQRRQTAITLTGLAAGVALLAGPYAYAAYVRNAAPFAFFGSVTATLVALAVIGFLGGLASGVAVAARATRGMARRDPRTHPEIVALTNAGWSYDPPGVD
jgi:VIT1/CCC1 family predicted Fe2+/Mn2+ transporter